jgi:acyl-homoserine lactone synthase
VGALNQHLHARRLDQMFRRRHVFYVEGHGWDGLTSRDGKETDKFDDEHAVYLMSIDPFGDVAASVRLNPTTGPTLLQKFGQGSDEPV